MTKQFMSKEMTPESCKESYDDLWVMNHVENNLYVLIRNRVKMCMKLDYVWITLTIIWK